MLVVDDDPDACAIVDRWLQGAGYRTRCFADAETFLDGIRENAPDVVCLDINLPGLSGLEALDLVRRLHSEVPVLMMTGEAHVDSVVHAMQKGAYDYVAKPLVKAKFLTTVRNAAERYQLTTEVSRLEHALDAEGSYGQLVGRSPAMRRLFQKVERVAARDVTVLVRGESGTGKELVARAIHEGSKRRRGPFVALNCAAIAESLQDSELFGHEKGAYTGAMHARQGRFEQADGGTLFLDEIAELTPALQAKLLRVLQERRFERVGGSTTVESDFRLVAATHRNLAELADAGRFRRDLYFRVAVVEVVAPALREREGDLAELVPALLSRLVQEGEPIPRVSSAAFELLSSHKWPGNVRELQNVLEGALCSSTAGTIEVQDLPEDLAPSASSIPAPLRSEAVESFRAVSRHLTADPPANDLTLAELEQRAIEDALSRTGGNVAEVGRRLGIGRTTLYRKLKKYGLR